MKKLLFTIVATFLFAFTSLAAGKPEMEFKVTSHDFGYIDEYGGNVSYEFEFTNTGDKPLMIISARANCGCTRPEFSKRPIVPGGKSTIKVTYVPKGRPGTFTKGVTVKTNIGVKHLVVKGVIVPKKQEEKQ